MKQACSRVPRLAPHARRTFANTGPSGTPIARQGSSRDFDYVRGPVRASGERALGAARSVGEPWVGRTGSIGRSSRVRSPQRRAPAARPRRRVPRAAARSGPNGSGGVPQARTGSCSMTPSPPACSIQAVQPPTHCARVRAPASSAPARNGGCGETGRLRSQEPDMRIRTLLPRHREVSRHGDHVARAEGITGLGDDQDKAYLINGPKSANEASRYIAPLRAPLRYAAAVGLEAGTGAKRREQQALQLRTRRVPTV
jgi:hypothetical protein